MLNSSIKSLFKIQKKILCYSSVRILSIMAILSLVTCGKNSKLNIKSIACDSTEKLVFQSGFESGTYGLPVDAHEDIFGVDNSVESPNNWVNDFDGNQNIGNFSIQYQGGDISERYAKIIKEPYNPNNNILLFSLKHPNVTENGVKVKGRIQANIYENNCLTEIYQTVKIYLPNDWNILKNSQQTFNWLTIMEFWNNIPTLDPKYPFRISLDIFKLDSSSPNLTFHVKGQIMPSNAPWDKIWEKDNTQFVIPVGQWVKLEVYFKEGNRDTGRFYFAVTPEGKSKEVIFDIHNFTHHPNDPSPDGLDRFNPMKLYTFPELIEYINSKNGTLQLYWDDFKLWKNKIPE